MFTRHSFFIRAEVFILFRSLYQHSPARILLGMHQFSGSAMPPSGSTSVAEYEETAKIDLQKNTAPYSTEFVKQNGQSI